MAERMERARKRPSFLLDARVLTAVTGLFLSVALHELFHIIVHWGHIVGVRFFADPFALVEVISVVPQGYNTSFEETIAYTITITTLLATIITVWVIHDAKDTRSVSQTIFPKQSQPIDPAQLAHLLS